MKNYRVAYIQLELAGKVPNLQRTATTATTTTTTTTGYFTSLPLDKVKGTNKCRESRL